MDNNSGCKHRVNHYVQMLTFMDSQIQREFVDPSLRPINSWRLRSPAFVNRGRFARQHGSGTAQEEG
jgi:hypothetical protein